MTIREFIESYAAAYRGHTPGHKGKADRRDVTEIGDVFPRDLVERAERAAAFVYGARGLRFLVNGSSIGIKAAVLALGEDFVTDGYCHRAVLEAADLAGVECYKMPLATDKANDLPALPAYESLINEMRNRGVRNAVIQYPDYYGRTADLPRLYAAVRSMGGTLICDSAHGAHFALRPDLFPLSAVKASDVCNLSAHKTLGAMTQTAFVAIGGDFDGAELNRQLDNLGTTSPNYILLASLESALADGMASADDYDRLKRFSDAFRAEIPCLKNDDFTRLAVDFGRGRGADAAKRLYDLGVACEKHDDRYVIFILTPYDTDEELEVLRAAAKKVWQSTGRTNEIRA